MGRQGTRAIYTVAVWKVEWPDPTHRSHFRGQNKPGAADGRGSNTSCFRLVVPYDAEKLTKHTAAVAIATWRSHPHFHRTITSNNKNGL